MRVDEDVINDGETNPVNSGMAWKTLYNNDTPIPDGAVGIFGRILTSLDWSDWMQHILLIAYIVHRLHG